MSVATLATSDAESPRPLADMLPIPSTLNGSAVTERQALMIEVCAGSGLLSSFFLAKGWQVRAIDWSRRASGSVPHLKADLATEMGRMVVFELVNMVKCLCVVLSPPSFIVDELAGHKFWAELLERALCRGVAVIVENAASSKLWGSSMLQNSASKHELDEVFFMAPGRTVRTKLLTNVHGLGLALDSCVCSPPLEKPIVPRDAFFRPEVCGAIFQEVRQHLVDLDLLVPMGAEFAGAFPRPEHQRLVQTRKQVPPLISEFLTIGWMGKSRVGGMHKILYDKGGDSETVWAGEWRSPEKFVQDAWCVQHPYDGTKMVPDELVAAIVLNLAGSPRSLAAFRVQQLKWVVELKRQVGSSRVDADDPVGSRIIGCKDVGLFRALLEYYGYPDLGVVDLVASGIELTGVPENSHVFERQTFDAPLSQADLAVVSKWNNRMLAAKIRSSGDPELDVELWSKVEAEIDRGWLIGPFDSLEDLEQLVGPDCVVSRRFAIRQGAKTRAIDDLSESQ
eukprot:6492161-Amphidinium_carterae.1